MVDLDEIEEDILDAFENGVEDPVSLVTLIEIYADQLDEEGTLDDKRKFLEILAEQLETQKEVTFKISWDMPKQLLKWASGKNIKIHETLRASKILPPLMKCFMSITIHGDPRELLISGCDILGSLSAEEETITYLRETKDDPELNIEKENDVYMERSPGDFFVGLKLHMVYELIYTSLKRIDTLYPSKYLNIAVAAFEKIITTNAITMEDPSILLRRSYLFCKTYMPNDPPKEVLLKDGTKLEGSDLQDIIDKEVIIQGKLLKHLCTFAVGEGLNGSGDRSEVQVYHSMARLKMPKEPFYETLVDSKLRFYDLALSFDIDLKQEMINCVNDSKRIYKALPKIEDVPTREAQRMITKGVMKLSFSYHLQKMAHDTSLTLHPQGILVLSSIYYLASKKHLYPEIPLSDTIFLYLRFASIGIISKMHSNRAVDGAIRYFMWVHMSTSSSLKLRKEMATISPFVLESFFECFLIKVSARELASDKTLQCTLFTRLLCCAPENISFRFICNVLRDFPYGQGKYLIIGILKQLFTTKFPKETDHEKIPSTVVSGKSQSEGKEDDLASQLSNLKIDDSNLITTTFIDLTSEKMSIITSIINDAIKEAKDSKESDEKFKTALMFLEFLLFMKTVWDDDLLKSIEADFKSLKYSKTVEAKLKQLVA